MKRYCLFTTRAEPETASGNIPSIEEPWEIAHYPAFLAVASSVLP